MKIAAVLENKIDSGGGFNQSLNAILQMRDLAEHQFDLIVVTSIRANVAVLNKLGVTSEYFKPSVRDKLLTMCALHAIGRTIQNKLKFIGPLERHLLKLHVDLVYFLSPSMRSVSLQHLNYIITVWDLCHRDTPEFPEVREFNQFLSREFIYHNCLAQALVILVDSDVLADRIVTRYGVDRDRIIAMPFSPSPFFQDGRQESKDVLQKYTLKSNYLFYPAQFWSHKNHIRILEALLMLKEKELKLHMVFCGSDQGNRRYIEKIVQEYRLSDQVHILGFVPSKDMQALYQHCRAVVMPTYFGPTNLPPLEAWTLRKPLIYSAHLSDQVGEAAICIDPDSAEDLANAMRLIQESDEVCNELTEKGIAALNLVNAVRKDAEKELQSTLFRFEKRRKCWF